jgi:alpha-ketoglutarate-dependent taurine dioxygenase
MPPPRRRLPSPREVPWNELRHRAATVFRYLQAGWDELSAAEREEVRRLVTKSRGRPRNLSRDEARRLGQLAGRAARAAGKKR